jgi:hypothetical protein
MTERFKGGRLQLRHRPRSLRPHRVKQLNPVNWYQMSFVSPEGREEVLWVEQDMAPDTFRVLNTPVWIYGVSVGTIVCGASGQSEYLRFVRVIRDSPGATVRFAAPVGTIASEVYRTRVWIDTERSGIKIGPATFFDPGIVSVYVRERRAWRDVTTYLDQLIGEGVLEEWELGDPDVFKPANQAPGEKRKDSVLVHPLPVDGKDGSTWC